MQSTDMSAMSFLLSARQLTSDDHVLDYFGVRNSEKERFVLRTAIQNVQKSLVVEHCQIARFEVSVAGKDLCSRLCKEDMSSD